MKCLVDDGYILQTYRELNRCSGFPVRIPVWADLEEDDILPPLAVKDQAGAPKKGRGKRKRIPDRLDEAQMGGVGMPPVDKAPHSGPALEMSDVRRPASALPGTRGASETEGTGAASDTQLPPRASDTADVAQYGQQGGGGSSAAGNSIVNVSQGSTRR